MTFPGPQDQHLVDEDTLEEDGSQDAELQGLTEDAVYTTMRFSRPFRSCDPHDRDITVKERGEEHLVASSLFPWAVTSPQPGVAVPVGQPVAVPRAAVSLSLPQHTSTPPSCRL